MKSDRRYPTHGGDYVATERGLEKQSIVASTSSTKAPAESPKQRSQVAFKAAAPTPKNARGNARRNSSTK